jgi:hypothetical protein
MSWEGKSTWKQLANYILGTGCEPTDIDVSPAMFDKMANHDLGRVLVTWAWL